ncbi:MAG: Cof-type HAD-IIB family hydrolase [Fimbriimonadaceae bacterium]|jgi:hypothetical protein|nr:Cof-type HAD-IIB family hydrolase [Fimbriimonadaceae bacterium]
MARRVDLIATDLDGTLLTSSRKIHPRNQEAILAAIAAGVVVCLASGRAINTMEPFAEQLGLTGPLVTCNGAYCVDSLGEEIHHFCLTPEARDIILDYGVERGLHTNCYVKDQIFFSSFGEWGQIYLGRIGTRVGVSELAVPEMYGLSPTKLLFIDHPDAVIEHEVELKIRLAPHGVSVVVSEPDYIEFLPSGINKSVGLQAVAQRLEIPRERVAAVGDWLNDKEMVAWAGIGGAVANAAEAVKAEATHLVASHDEGGVAEFIELVL